MMDRFTVRVQARFESAHFLRSYRGVAEPLHGHSYLVEAELVAASGTLDVDNLAVDFVAARRELEGIARVMDYRCINEVPPFTDRNPSAENIAEWFHERLTEVLQGEKAIVRSITLWEGPVNSVVFRPGER